MEINEFTAKKLGEVMAFAEVGLETFEKGKIAFNEVLGESRVEDIISSHKQRIDNLRNFAKESKTTEITLKKAELTGVKLRHMRDYYVGEEWDNPAELLEWSGFFEGASLVHWALVVGAADKLENESLQKLSEDGKIFHENILNLVQDSIKNLGNRKA